MTMVNAWKDGDKAYLVMDTACIDFDSGNVIAFASKILTAAEWPAVMGITAVGGRVDHATRAFEEKPPEDIEDLKRRMTEACLRYLQGCNADGFDNSSLALFVVAWCEKTNEPRIFNCSSHKQIGAAFEVMELDFTLCPGTRSPIENQVRSRLKAGKGLNLKKHVIPMAEVQRKTPMPVLNTSAMMPGVGGSLECVSVSKDGLDYEVLHSWTDRVGLPLSVAH